MRIHAQARRQRGADCICCDRTASHHGGVGHDGFRHNVAGRGRAEREAGRCHGGGLHGDTQCGGGLACPVAARDGIARLCRQGGRRAGDGAGLGIECQSGRQRRRDAERGNGAAGAGGRIRRNGCADGVDDGRLAVSQPRRCRLSVAHLDLHPGCSAAGGVLRGHCVYSYGADCCGRTGNHPAGRVERQPRRQSRHHGIARHGAAADAGPIRDDRLAGLVDRRCHGVTQPGRCLDTAVVFIGDTPRQQGRTTQKEYRQPRPGRRQNCIRCAQRGTEGSE
ncbi:hypothetical protein D3C81_1194950 [compost metagenome]